MAPPLPLADRVVRLTIETESACRLLRESLGILSRSRPGPHDADALFACLALGLEKILKLCIGLRSTEETGLWSSIKEMRGVGHDIVTMNHQVLTFIRDNPTKATNSSLVLKAVEDIEEQRLMRWVIVAMSSYAKRGRFYNLDFLAEGDPGVYSPAQYWSTLEQEVLTPSLIAGTIVSDDSPNPWRREAVSQTASAIRAWITCIQVAWTQGMFGPHGRMHAHVLAAVTR